MNGPIGKGRVIVFPKNSGYLSCGFESATKSLGVPKIVSRLWKRILRPSSCSSLPPEHAHGHCLHQFFLKLKRLKTRTKNPSFGYGITGYKNTIKYCRKFRNHTRIKNMSMVCQKMQEWEVAISDAGRFSGLLTARWRGSGTLLFIPIDSVDV